jgi:hypothetical protein
MDVMKVCSKCGERKPATLEYFRKHQKGLRPNCISCDKQYHKMYRKVNREKISAQKKQQYEANKEAVRNRVRSYNKANRAKKSNYERRYRRQRMKKDTTFKLVSHLRSRVWKAVSGYSRGDKTLDLIGCSVEFLKSHLEQQFERGMSWDNYGEWHIDHIRPCASFDLGDPVQQKQCFHYTNLQPLWATENLTKSARWEDEAK